MSASVRRLTSRRVSGLSCRSLSTGCDGGGIQGGMNFENGGQLGKLQQFADQIAGSSQRDRALAGLRRQGNRYKCSEASSTPLRSITTRRVWGASSANSPDSA